jgi:AbrB family looped-hinge helix DNA binding protein
VFQAEKEGREETRRKGLRKIVLTPFLLISVWFSEPKERLIVWRNFYFSGLQLNTRLRDMNLAFESRIGKKFAVYLPKAVVEALGLREGDRVLIRVSGSTLTLEMLQDPLELALSGKKFASITPEQVEEISLEEQTSRIEGSP